jgi:hypothetical protein
MSSARQRSTGAENHREYRQTNHKNHANYGISFLFVPQRSVIVMKSPRQNISYKNGINLLPNGATALKNGILALKNGLTSQAMGGKSQNRPVKPQFAP